MLLNSLIATQLAYLRETGSAQNRIIFGNAMYTPILNLDNIVANITHFEDL